MLRLIPFAAFAVLSLTLGGCGDAEVGINIATPTSSQKTVSPTAVNLSTGTPTPLIDKPSFEVRTYRDESLGFQLEYPANWDEPVLLEEQSRGTIVQASVDGEVQMDIVTLLWNPKNDLDAYLEVRERAFEGSGFTILSKEVTYLTDSWSGVGYEIETATGERAYFFFTPIGDQYLQLSGSGDLDQLAEIASTVRPIE